MKEVTKQEFIDDAERLMNNAIAYDDFLKIRTAYGNAILISEAEWNIHVDAMRLVLTSDKLE